MLSQRSHVSPVTRYIDTWLLTFLAQSLLSSPGLREYSISRPLALMAALTA